MAAHDAVAATAPTGSPSPSQPPATHNVHLRRAWERARVFFAQLADPATLQPADADTGYLDLPVHPSLGPHQTHLATEERPGRGAVVPLLSRVLARTYMDAILEQCQPTVMHNALCLHGLSGTGKSYALYEAVCRLMAQRDTVRVAYVHDCRAWSAADKEDAIAQLLAVVASAFDPATERDLWELCAKLRTLPELQFVVQKFVPARCKAYRLHFVWIFDQHHELPVSHCRELPWSFADRELMMTPDLRGLGTVVTSSVESDEAALRFNEYRNMHNISLYHGYTDDEADRWRRHHRLFMEDQEGWAEAKQLLNTMPCELDALRRRTEPTLGLCLQGLARARFATFLVQKRAHRARYESLPFVSLRRVPSEEFLLDMLMGCRPMRPPGNLPLVYQDGHTGRARPFHELARCFYLQLHNPNILGDLFSAVPVQTADADLPVGRS
jgi:hypothetical protein